VWFNGGMTEWHDLYLAFGANLGDRAVTMRAARERLAPAVEVVRSSSLYETPPWGVLDQPPFLNATCHARTTLSPHALLAYLKTIERALGRETTMRWGPRAIDLDILFFDDLILNTPTLRIPHPLLHERAFVLIPLHEISPTLQHPVLGTTVAALVDALPDDLQPCAGADWRF
jgi:2-amino-4-hydroxy-6-hydroxymethyldihydropteridine diphosphokinase